MHYSDPEFNEICHSANGLGYEMGRRAVENGSVTDTPLAGEYADDMTPDTLFVELGIDEDDLSEVEKGIICDDYEEGYFAAVNGN